MPNKIVPIQVGELVTYWGSLGHLNGQKGAVTLVTTQTDPNGTQTRLHVRLVHGEVLSNVRPTSVNRWDFDALARM